MFQNGKIKFKKKKFAAKARTRPVDVDDDGAESSFSNVKTGTSATISKRSRWAKYSSLQAAKPEDNSEISGENDNTNTALTPAEGLAVFSGDDDPMVVDSADLEVTNDSSLAAYVTLQNNTFSVSETHFKESVPTLTQEYDDDDVNEVNQPRLPHATVEKDDIDMYDVEAYSEEKPKHFNEDMYAFEIMSDGSDDAIPRIQPQKLGSLDELRLALRERVSALEKAVSDSNSELVHLQNRLEEAKTARAEAIAAL